jgi:hypothetical protein
MPTPFTLSGVFTYPPDDGQPDAKRDFTNTGNFDSKCEKDLDLVGAGTEAVGFGTVLAAKALIIEVAATAQAPVNIRINGGTDDIEIAPGGFLAYASPVAVAGITALDIVYTMNAKVKVRILG